MQFPQAYQGQHFLLYGNFPKKSSLPIVNPVQVKSVDAPLGWDFMHTYIKPCFIRARFSCILYTNMWDMWQCVFLNKVWTVSVRTCPFRLRFDIDLIHTSITLPFLDSTNCVYISLKSFWKCDCVLETYLFCFFTGLFPDPSL